MTSVVSLNLISLSGTLSVVWQREPLDTLRAGFCGNYPQWQKGGEGGLLGWFVVDLVLRPRPRGRLQPWRRPRARFKIRQHINERKDDGVCICVFVYYIFELILFVSWSAVASISVGGLRSSSSSSSSCSSSGSSAGATAGGVDAGRPGANMIKTSVKVSSSGDNVMRKIRQDLIQKCGLF